MKQPPEAVYDDEDDCEDEAEPFVAELDFEAPTRAQRTVMREVDLRRLGLPEAMLDALRSD